MTLNLKRAYLSFTIVFPLSDSMLRCALEFVANAKILWSALSIIEVAERQGLVELNSKT